MQYRIDIGSGNLLVFEDDGDKHMKVMVVDSKDQGTGMFLGRCLRADVKRLGRGM
jgi:hypothetical protein